jgi:hypothetical protein
MTAADLFGFRFGGFQQPENQDKPAKTELVVIL